MFSALKPALNATKIYAVLFAGFSSAKICGKNGITGYEKFYFVY